MKVSSHVLFKFGSYFSKLLKKSVVDPNRLKLAKLSTSSFLFKYERRTAEQEEYLETLGFMRRNKLEKPTAIKHLIKENDDNLPSIVVPFKENVKPKLRLKRDFIALEDTALLLMDYCKEDKLVTSKHLKDIHLQFQDSTQYSKSWVNQILNILSSEDHDPKLKYLAEKLFDFVSSNAELKVEPVTLIMYLGCIGKHGKGEEDSKKAGKIYSEICDTIEIEFLNGPLTSKIISGLTLANKFLDIKKIIENLRNVKELRSHHIETMLGYAIVKDLADDVKTYAAHIYQYRHLPSNEMFRYITSHGNMEHVIHLLNIARKQEWIVMKKSAHYLVDFFHRNSLHPCRVLLTEANRDGRCLACNHLLTDLTPLSSEQFEHLKNVFIEKILDRGNIFINSNPQELKTFERIMERQGPFDYVIDGLNVSYTDKVKNGFVLAHVVTHLVERKNMKVLVIGRNHMRAWSHAALTVIKNQSTLFFTENNTQDDVYLMYAALMSGPNAKMLTNDEFREHRSLLGAYFSDLLQRFQRANQVGFSGFTASPRAEAFVQTPNFVMPKRHDTVAQKSRFGWHIPYDDGTERSSSYALPDSWLCVQYQTNVDWYSCKPKPFKIY